MRTIQIKLFFLVFSMFLAIPSLWGNATILVKNTTLSPTPLENFYTQSEGTLSFSIVESSGEVARAHHPLNVQRPNITFSVELSKLQLKNLDISLISGSVLNVFDVSYIAGVHPYLYFSQKSELLAFADLTVSFPVQTTGNADSNENNLNTININIHASDSQTFTNNSSASFSTYTKKPNVTTSTLSISHPTRLADNLSISTITLVLKNANGVLFTDGNDTVIFTTTGGAVLSSVINNHDGTYSATIKNALAQTVSISASINTIAVNQTVSVQFTQMPISTVTSILTANPVSVPANNIATSIITLQAKDSQGNNILTGGSNIRFITSGTATLSTVVDNNDGTYTATIKNASAQRVRVYASINNVISLNTVDVQFTPSIPNHITSTLSVSASSVLADGITISTIILQAKDSQGNNITTGGENIQFTTSGNAILSTVTDNNNGTYTATISNNTVQNVVITATVNTVAAHAVKNIQFVAGVANVSTSILTESPNQVEANGVQSSIITLQLKDIHGNLITTGGHAVTLSASGNGVLTNILDNNNGTYTATLTNSTAQNVVISAKLNNVTVTDVANVAFVVGGVSLTTSVVSSSLSSVAADGTATSTLTLQAKDAQGNNLTTGGASISFNASGGSAVISSVADNGDGTYTATISNTNAQTVVVTGLLNGSAVSNNTTITFTVGNISPTLSTLTGTPTTLISNGIASSTVTLQAKDAQGNNLTTGGANIQWSATGSGTLSNMIDNNDGTYTVQVTNTIAESVNISVTMNGVSATNTEDISFIAGNISKDTSTLNVSSSTVVADGTTGSIITLQAKDAQGNNLSTGGANIQFNNTGNATISTVIDNNNGTYTATISNTTAQSVVISTMINNIVGAQSQTLQFTAGTPNATTSTVTQSPSEVEADGIQSSTITFQVKDINGNLLTTGGHAVTLSVSGDAILSNVVDNNNGTYTATLTNNTAQNVIVSATLNNTIVTDVANIAFVVGAISPTQSLISASLTPLPADGLTTSTLTLQAKDAQGNNLTTGGATVSFSASGGSAVVSNVIDNGNGSYTATITNTQAQTVRVYGVINNVTASNTVDISFTPSIISQVNSTLTVSTSSLTADGTSTSIITLQAKDAQGNNITTGGATINLSTTGDAILSNLVDNGDGTYTASITNTTAETITLSSVINGGTGTSTSTIVFTTGVISPSTSTLTASSISVLADNSTTSTITLQAKDVQGNNITTGGANIVFHTSGSAVLGSTVDHGDGTYSTTIHNTLAQTVQISASINTVNSTNTVSVEFTTLAPDYAPSMTLVGSPVLGASGKIDVSILIRELIANGVNTNDLRFSIVKNQSLVLTLDATVSSNNQDWLMSETGGFYLFTYTKGNRKFPALGQSTIALTGTFITPIASSGQYDLTATILHGSGDINGNNDVDAKTLAYNNLTIDAGQSRLLASPSTVNANGIATSTITLEAKDSSGALLNSGGATVTFSRTGSAVLSAVTDNNDGTYTATLSNSVEEVTVIACIINGVVGTANVSVTFSTQILNLLSTSPVDDVTNVNALSDLSMTFSGNVSKIQGKKFKIFRTLGNIELINLDMNTVQITGDNTSTLTVNPNEHLIYGEAHYVQIDTGAVEDNNHIAYAGISDTTTWNFSVPSNSGACGCDTLDNCDLSIGSQLNAQGIQSLNIIQAYTNGSNIVPTSADYIAAGITGVSSNGVLSSTFTPIARVSDIHINTINQVLTTYNADEVDTAEEIQAIVNDLIAQRNAGISISTISGHTSEAGRTANFGIKLNSQPTANVTIALHSNDTTEGTIDKSSVTFTSNTWSTAQIITISGVDDSTEDGDISYKIITGKSISTDSHYHHINPVDISVVNDDVDTQSHPTLTGTNPSNNATQVNATQDLVMTFSKDIQVVAGKAFSIYKSIGDIELIQLDMDVEQITGSETNSLTINPNTHLVYGAKHYIQIDAGAIKDYSNHEYVGMNDSNTWTFTVESNSGACRCDALDNCDLEKTEQLDSEGIASLEAIQAYTVQGNNVPTLNDYLSVGVAGVHSLNINKVNTMIENSNISDMSTVEALQDMIDSAIAGFEVSSISNPTGEDGRTANFSIKLSSKPKSNVTLSFSSSDESEGIVSAQAIVFTEQNWNILQYMTVTGVPDTVNDGNVSYQIIPSLATSSDTNYAGKKPSNIDVVNIYVFSLIATTPIDNANNVQATQNLSMLFTENTQTIAGKKLKIIRIDTNDAHSTIDMSSTEVTGSGTHTLVINPMKHLGYGMDYYVTIDNGAVKDSNGNDSKAIMDKTTWNFSISSGSGGCACDTLDNCDLAGLQQFSAAQKETLNKIIKYTQEANNTRPRFEDYQMIGISGVTRNNFSSVTAGLVNYTGILDTPESIQIVVDAILRDLSAMVIVSESSKSSHTNENGTTSTFSIKLSLAPLSTVSIRLLSSDSTEGVVPITTMTFTPSNWDVLQTATVTGVADNEVDGDTAFYITATSTSLDSAYEGKEGYIMIINDNVDIVMDSDGDSMSDEIEDQYGFDKNDASDGTQDADNDGVQNATEIQLGMNPTVVDDLGGNSDSEKYILHVLNRLSYGATKPLLNYIEDNGIETWIEEQLTSPQTSLDPADTVQQKRDAYYLNHPYRIQVLPTIRPLHSQRQLQTLMGHFWDNHFNTYFGKHLDGPGELYEEDQFYLHSLGNFKTLLMLSAKSSTMSRYLDGHRNIKGKPNENYGREVMELSTLGIDGGYTDEDIVQLSRILTGWTYSFQGKYSRYNGYTIGEPRNNAIYEFNFNANNHDVGANKPFLIGNGGKVIVTRTGEEGVKEAEEALDILAKHPKTAAYICKKMARKFIADIPSIQTLNACESTFLAQSEAANQIELVLRTLFKSREFQNTMSYHNKLKDTQEYLLSLARLLEVDATQFDGDKAYYNNVGWRISTAKQGFFYKPEPTGYAEISSAWNQTDIALKRLQEANKMINDSRMAISLSEFFTHKKLTNEKALLSFLLPLTTGGFYEGLDIQKAYEILRPNHEKFTMDEEKLRELLTWLIAQAEFHVQ